MPTLYQLSQKESLTPAEGLELDALLEGKTVEELNEGLDGGYPVLIYATKTGNIELIAKLLEKGVDKNITVNVAKYGNAPVMKTALQIAGSAITKYKRTPPGGGRRVADEDLKIVVISALGGEEDDSWRKYAGQDFLEAFDDSIAEEDAMPVAESSDVLDDAGKKRKGTRRKRKGTRRKHKGTRRKRKGSRRKRNSRARGRTHRVTAAKQRHAAATRARHRAATRRRDRVAAIRKAQAISDQIRHDRRNRYLAARNDPDGRYGQKWDEAGYDMYD